MAWSNHWLVSIFLLDKALYDARAAFLRLQPNPSDKELKAFLMPLLGVCELENVNWQRLRQEWHASMVSPLEGFTTDPLPESRFILDQQGNPASWCIQEHSEGARIVFLHIAECAGLETKDFPELLEPQQ
jgi:hypothetical protein